MNEDVISVITDLLYKSEGSVLAAKMNFSKLDKSHKNEKLLQKLRKAQGLIYKVSRELNR